MTQELRENLLKLKQYKKVFDQIKKVKSMDLTPPMGMNSSKSLLPKPRYLMPLASHTKTYEL